MAEEEKAKLIEPEEVNRRVEGLRKSVAEMADYIRIDERRGKLAELEAKQASGDFWNNLVGVKENGDTSTEGMLVGPGDIGAGGCRSKTDGKPRSGPEIQEYGIRG